MINIYIQYKIKKRKNKKTILSYFDPLTGHTVKVYTDCIGDCFTSDVERTLPKKEASSLL